MEQSERALRARLRELLLKWCRGVFLDEDPGVEVTTRPELIMLERCARELALELRKPVMNEEEKRMRDSWPKELGLLWEAILAWLPSVGRKPESVSIAVIPVGTGGGPLQPNLRGDQVLSEKPGELLRKLIADVYGWSYAVGKECRVGFYFPVSRYGSGWESLAESDKFTLKRKWPKDKPVPRFATEQEKTVSKKLEFD